jgi:hypothetical protein
VGGGGQVWVGGVGGWHEKERIKLSHHNFNCIKAVDILNINTAG